MSFLDFFITSQSQLFKLNQNTYGCIPTININMRMLRNISNISDNKKRLLSNFFSLSILQGVNYILPLITLPYLVRVLGPEKYGLIAFSLALIQYFIVITDYGFNYSATREISVNREDSKKVSEIFSSVMFIKIMIMILCFIALCFIVFTFEKFKADYLVYLLTFGMVLGYVLFPIWFFQGIEKMKYIAYINILAKLLFTVSIFILIKKPSHYIYVPLLNSMGFIIAGILASGIAMKNFGINFREISKESIKYHFRDGWHIFISTISINFYKTNCIFVLGLFTNNTVVGYFSIIKKLIDASNQLAVIASQSIYPYISKRIKESFDRSVIFLKKVGASLFAFTFLVGLAFLIFADVIVYLVAGESFSESVLSLRIMAFVPLIIGVNVPAVQILLGHGLDKEFSRVVGTGALLDVILNFSLVPHLSYVGSCMAVIGAELFVTLGLYYKVIKKFGYREILSFRSTN